jgi:SAM-dependent methyltransferase
LQLTRLVHQSHAFAASTGSGLQHHWISNLLGDLLRFNRVAQRFGRTRHQRYAGRTHGLASAGLGTHDFHCGSGGADELHVRIGARPCEVWVFREKTVSGMDGFRAADLGDVQDLADVQVGLLRGRRADMVSVVGFTYVQRATINVGENDDRLDTHFPASANDPDCDLTAVCNQNALEHRVELSLGRSLRRTFDARKTLSEVFQKLRPFGGKGLSRRVARLSYLD